MRRLGAMIVLMSLLAACGGLVPEAIAGETRVLVIYNEGKSPALAAQWVVPALLNLLGHFDVTSTVVPAEAYQAGEVEAHEAVIYVGLGAGQALPEALLADIHDSDRSVCWLGGDLEQMAQRFSLDHYGFRSAGSQPASYPRVVYHAQVLKRPKAPLTTIAVTHRASCQVLASAEGDGKPLPYAVRSGRFWYFADVPVIELGESGSSLVLSDQLHEILSQPHPPRRTALICIAGVNAETDPGSLRMLLSYLLGEELPFAVAVIPMFRDPQEDLEIPLSGRRSVVGIVRGAQRAGAAVIANGFSHQFLGRSGEDAEFWDMSRNRPPLNHTPAQTAERMRAALTELARCGLYPLAWATPRGRATAADYAEMAQSCSTVWERRLTSVLAPAPQSFPFPIERDGFGQRVIPDNLGLLGASGDLETVLEQARCQTVVSDPWLTTAIAPDAPLEAVKLLIAGLREMGFEFADLRRTSNWMRGQSLEIHSVQAPTPILALMPTGWDATVLGPGRRELARFERLGGDQREKSTLLPGAILLSYPSGARPHEVFALEGGPEELAQRAVSGIARVAMVFAVGACVLFILIYLVQISLRRRA